MREAKSLKVIVYQYVYASMDFLILLIVIFAKYRGMKS